MKRTRAKSRRQYVLQSDAGVIASKLPGAKADKLPRFVEPSLATLQGKIPTAAGWVHEIKFDGYRLQLRRDDNDIRFLTRRGNDWTPRFKALVTPAWELQCHSCILDGEVVVPTNAGTTDFGALQNDLGSRSDRFVFFAFDVLYLNGFDLRGCRFDERRRVLEALLEGVNGEIRISETIEGSGPGLFKQACELGLEGIVSKRLDAKYRSGRSPNWTKVTCRKRDTFVVAGIAYEKGHKFDGIYLARKNGKGLQYAGKVENGFDAKTEKELRQRGEKLKTKVQPLTPKIRKPKATWLKPEMQVDVEYRALTGDGKLRHPSFKGIREDL